MSPKLAAFIAVGAATDRRRIAAGKEPLSGEDIRFVARGLGLLRQFDALADSVPIACPERREKDENEEA